MEYISGTPMDQVDLKIHTDIIPRMANIIRNFGSVPKPDPQIPGPVGGGEPEGYLWGDNGAKTTFNSVEDVNGLFNKRLMLRE